MTYIFGTPEDDQLMGMNGENDVIYGYAGDDTLIGGPNDDYLAGGTGADYLIGGNGSDTLTADPFDGLPDVFEGGAGQDLLFYSASATAGVTVNLAAGTAAGGSTVSGIEAVVGTRHTDTLTGDADGNSLSGVNGDDVLDGGGGGDLLDGGHGRDILRGGAGDDTLRDTDIDGDTGPDLLNGGAGSDTVDYSFVTRSSTIDLAAGTINGAAVLTSIENVRGTQGDDTITGSAGANFLFGGAGTDVLRGGAGDDRLEGGRLESGPSGLDSLYGEAGDDVLYQDILLFPFVPPSGPPRLLDGGDGVDTADYGRHMHNVYLDLQTGTGLDGYLTLVSIENLRGSDFDYDTLIGNAGVNGLYGNGGDDVVRGGGGGDRLDGGAGSDTAKYDEGNVGIVVDLSTGAASGGNAQGDVLVSIESLTGSQANDSLTGNDGDNALAGEAGDDVLRGGHGDDVLRGGAGADLLDGGGNSNINDTAMYNEGNIGVVVDLSTGTGSGGNAQGDVLVSIENLTGSRGNDSLTGNAGGNTLAGDIGDDVLRGGAGQDVLRGGAGGDRFVFAAVTDSRAGAPDRITDFSQLQGDRVDLSAIDANTAAAGNQAFSFIGTALYSGVAGQLRYASDGTNTAIAGDVNGDGVSDFRIRLTGAIGLVAGDFVL
jgi:Ca2+-binding RTX toxin-like protein